MFESISFWSATTLYALATVAFFAFVSFERPWARAAGVVLILTAMPLHIVSLGLRWAAVGHGPYSTRYEVFSSNAIVLAAIFLASAWRIPRLRSLGVAVAPAIFVLMGLAVSSFDVKYEVTIIFKSWWLFLHIGFAKLFGACTVLAAAAAMAYLWRSAKEAPEWLPAAEALDLYAHQFLLVAFLFLGVMIIAGSLWANQSWGRYWGWDPIEISSLITWLAYGVILHFRVLHHWSGKRMAWLTIVALVFAIQTIYLVAIIVPTIHDRYLVAP